MINLIVIGHVNAQEVIGVTGISLHSLSKLKKLQRNYINEAIVTLESTQSFPPYLQHGLTVRFPITAKISVGASAYGTSTAARSDYQDYTGMIRVDQSLRCIGAGAYVNYVFQEFEKGKFALYALAGAEHSTLNLNINIQIGNSGENDKETFKALSPMCEFGFESVWHLPRQFFVHMNAGFHVSRQSMLTASDNSEYEKVNWTGAKVLMGLGYRF